MAASVQATLPYHELPDDARKGDIIPGLQNDLVSVKKLADAKLTTVLHEHGAEVYPAQALTIIATTAPVLRGCRDKAGLWRVVTAQTPTTAQTLTRKSVSWHQQTKMESIVQPLAANAVFDLPSIAQAIKWHHASLGFPTKDTLIKSINNGHFVTWPLLTQHNVSKHFPESDETIMGHTNQQRQGVRSTKPKPAQPETVAVAEADNNERTNAIGLAVYKMTHTIHSDQTGRLPCRSRTGNQYIMVILHEDSNYAFEEPMKNKSDEEMQRAYSAIITRIQAAKLTVTKHILDNECSAAMKQLITKTCKYELVPPGIHRRNKAEVTIKAFKQHLLSVFAGLDPSFPMSQWDKLIPQVEITMNLLRQSKANPEVSAYEYVHGPFDYNRYPLAPIGCAVQIHNQASKRGTWAPHTQPGWYLGPSFEHYRCHRVLPKTTQVTRVCETVVFKHKRYTMPQISPAYYITDATQQLIATIKKADGIPSTATSQLDHLEQLTELYRRRVNTHQEAPHNTTTTVEKIHQAPTAHNSLI